jgi:hypothetical protein
MNCDFYVDNCGGEDLSYDGLTTTFPGVVPVSPGSTYHVKIAIADAMDMVFDSGVFIQKQSFRSANVLSLSDASLPNNMKIFPNPSSDELILEGLAEDLYVFQFINLTGQMLHQESKTVSGIVNLDIRSMAAGQYFLRVQGNNGSSFIIEFQKD